jgi:hypothetical protein
MTCAREREPRIGGRIRGRRPAAVSCYHRKLTPPVARQKCTPETRLSTSWSAADPVMSVVVLAWK